MCGAARSDPGVTRGMRGGVHGLAQWLGGCRITSQGGSPIAESRVGSGGAAEPAEECPRPGTAPPPAAPSATPKSALTIGLLSSAGGAGKVPPGVAAAPAPAPERPLASGVGSSRSSQALLGVSKGASAEAEALEAAAIFFPELPNFPRGLHVLLVEDNVVCARFALERLRQLDYEVKWCTSGEDALQELQRASCCFHFVLCDVRLQQCNGHEGKNGFDVLHAAVSRNLPVVLMSEDAAASNVMKGLVHGCVAYLAKPVTVSDIDSLWKRTLAAKRAAGSDQLCSTYATRGNTRAVTDGGVGQLSMDSGRLGSNVRLGSLVDWHFEW